jgi:hypothetical protein
MLVAPAVEPHQTSPQIAMACDTGLRDKRDEGVVCMEGMMPC